VVRVVRMGAMMEWVEHKSFNLYTLSGFGNMPEIGWSCLSSEQVGADVLSFNMGVAPFYVTCPISNEVASALDVKRDQILMRKDEVYKLPYYV
jgi:hypothetical protein